MPARYDILYRTSPKAVELAFTYNPATKLLTSVNLQCAFERVAGDYWAIKLDDDYSMVFDSDGLLVGDIKVGMAAEFPRLEFYCATCGLTTFMAALTKSGSIHVPAVEESDTMPEEGVNILDQICIAPRLTTVGTQANELWFLTVNGDYLTVEGKLLAVRP